MLTSIPAVTVNLSENGHPDYVVVTSRDGLDEGAIVTLTSLAHTKTGLKVQKLKGRQVYLWDPSTQTMFDASSYLVSDSAQLVQAAQDLFGGLVRDFFIDPGEDQTPLATSELAGILTSILPGGAGAASNVTVLNFPAQQHTVVDNTLSLSLENTQNTGVINGHPQNVAMPLGDSASAAFTVTGVWTGTFVFEGSADAGATWFATECFNPNAAVELASSTTTTNGVFQVLRLSGLTDIRIRTTAFSLGAANIYISGTNSSSDTFLAGAKENGSPVPSYGAMMAGNNGGTTRFLKVTADGSISVDTTVLTNGTQHTVVDNFPASQPVTVASLPLPTGAAQDSTLTGGTQKTQVVQGGNTLVVDASGHIGVNVENAITVSGTVNVGNAITVSGTVDIGSPVAVTGTFWQPTQPVSAVALPLPTGAAQDSTLTGGSQKTQIVQGANTLAVDGSGRIGVNVANTVTVTGTVAVTQPVAVTGTFWQASQPITVAALPLPSGAATDASLTNGNQVTQLTGWTKIDANNSTSTPLGAGLTFTGIATDTAGFTAVQTSVFTDQAGTIFIEESSDGTNWDVLETTALSAMSAGNGQTVGRQVSARYFRVVFTNGATPQSSFRLQSILTKGGNSGDTVQIGGPTLAGLKAQVTKTVLFGREPVSEGNSYREAQIDIRGALLTEELGTHGTFGSKLVTNEVATSVFKSTYGIDTRLCNVTTANGGSVVWNAGRAQLQTSAANNGSAKLATREAVRYVPGQGNIARGAPVFSISAANSRQAWGFLTDDNGYGFGYNGTSFGILIRNNSLDTWIPQASWNGDDKFDGTGPSGITLDPTKGSPMQIQMQWLGFGAVRWFIEDPNSGFFVLVHILKFSNTSTTPAILQPNLPVRIEAVNTGSTTNLSAFICSMGGYSEGDREVPGSDVRFSFNNSFAAVNTTGAQVFSVRNKLTNIFGGTNINTINVHIDQVTARDSSAGDMYFNLVLNGTLVGTSFADISTTSSVMQSNTAGTYTAGTGITLMTFSLAGGNTLVEFLRDYNIRLIPGDTLTMVAFAESSNVAGRIALGFHEEQ